MKKLIYFTLDDFFKGNVKIEMKKGYHIDIDRVTEENGKSYIETWVSDKAGETIECLQVTEENALEVMLNLAKKYDPKAMLSYFN